MLKRKKTTASGKLVLVISVHRTRSHRMKFCVQRGLGGIPQQAAPEAEWLSRGIACHLAAPRKSSQKREKRRPSLLDLRFSGFL